MVSGMVELPAHSFEPQRIQEASQLPKRFLFMLFGRRDAQHVGASRYSEHIRVRNQIARLASSTQRAGGEHRYSPERGHHAVRLSHAQVEAPGELRLRPGALVSRDEN